MIASATLVSGARITPIPWVPSSSFRMTTGAPPTRSIAASTSWRYAHERRGGDADVVAREDLDRAQFVARIGDTCGGVRRVHVHLFELPNDGEAEERDGGADAGEGDVVVTQWLPAVLEVRFVSCEVDGEAQRVEHPHFVAAVDRSGSEPLGAVHIGCS